MHEYLILIEFLIFFSNKIPSSRTSAILLNKKYNLLNISNIFSSFQAFRVIKNDANLSVPKCSLVFLI